jgi:hypothetical protein
MALPNFVALTNHMSNAKEIAVTPKIMICVVEMTAPPTLMGVVDNKVGNGL